MKTTTSTKLGQIGTAAVAQVTPRVSIEPSDDAPMRTGPAAWWDYLDKLAVAQMFGVTPRTVDKWMVERKLPFFKIGKLVRFRRSDIDAHLDAKFRVGGAL
jgi:excisionase family DNA binding protein